MLEVGRKQFLVTIAITLLLSLATIFSHPMEKFDRVWSDIILTSEKTPVDQKYLIVDITAQDIRQSDGAHLPRGQLAQTLTCLNEAGAERVLIDLTLSEALSSKNDSSLLKAMSNFGPQRLALPQGGAEKFSAHATLVDLGLLTDPDGWTRAVRTSQNSSGYNPAAWLATGQLSKEKVNIDLRYAPSTLERVSLGAILAGYDKDISGYNVIISRDPSIASSRVQLPLGNGPDRSALIALGGLSVSTGYQGSVKKSWLAALSIALILMVLGLISATLLKNKRLLLMLGLAMTITVVGLNIFMMRIWGGQGYPIMQYICFLIGITVTIAYRLRLFQMVSGFLKGDLSPEEAWAWRAHEDSKFPVILLNAMGNVRRMNPAAEEIKAWLGEDSENTGQLEFKTGAKEISLVGQNGLGRKFELEWPHSAVAIILMKDVTEATLKFDNLQKSQTEAIERADTYEQKKNQAEAASQQKTDFLANMSHELRTPLNAINGFADIMDREVFGPLGDARYKEFTSNILFSGEHLLSLINDILDLSKIEAGEMKLNIEQVEVGGLISQALRIVNARAQNGHLRLIYENTNLPQINADSRAIKQILLNLLTNAIKFTPEGGVVKVSAEAHPTALVLRVSDSGIGIPQEDIKRLAQPFQQVDNEKSKTMEGTGLGLSLSKSLVELHGGTFTIESMVGKGTMITFTIPHAQIEQPAEIPAAKLYMSAPVPRGPVTPPTFLKAS